MITPEMNWYCEPINPEWVTRTKPGYISPAEAKERPPIYVPRSSQALAYANREICGLSIPKELESLAEAIEKSRWMLALEDDWDGEGSPSYQEETWKRAVTFLLENALSLWNEKGIRIQAPAIHNGPEGSIDLYWETADRKLLINVLADAQEAATFYGYDSRQEVKGILQLSAQNRWLILWQME